MFKLSIQIVMALETDRISPRSEAEKLYFIKNIEDLKIEGTKSVVFEYEVIADAHLTDDFDYGPYKLCIWEFGAPYYKGQERKMCLRIRYSSKEESDNDGDSTNAPMKKSGSSQGGGLPDELISLASLFLRRRLKLGPIVREDDRPLYFPNRRRGGHWIDEPLVNGESKLNELTRWFKLVENLNIKYHLKFGLSARLYHRALLLIEEEPDLAYLNLVSAIEVLCDEPKIEGAKIDDLDQDLKPLIEYIEDKRWEEKLQRQFCAEVS